MSLEKRFLEKVNKTNKCWIWTASKDTHGYGQIRDGERTRLAHRVSYEFYNGPIPDNLCCLHTCDNPACVNPNHLWLGTHADNARDKIKKGRFKFVYGQDTGNSKLTNDEVAEIRAMHKSGKYSQDKLADIFGVAQSAISNIVRRITWKHIE